MTDDEELAALLEHISSVEPPPMTEQMKEEMKGMVAQKVEEKKSSKYKDDSLDLPPTKFKRNEPEPISIEIDEPPDPALLVKADTQPAPAEIIKPSIPIDEIGQELATQFKSSIGRVNEVTDEIIQAYRADRLQAQSAIDHFFEVIERGGKTARVYVEKLPDILRVKNEISTNAIKVLDSITKFMAATKGSQIMVQNTNPSGVNLDDLAAILNSGEKYEDED